MVRLIFDDKEVAKEYQRRSEEYEYLMNRMAKIDSPHAYEGDRIKLAIDVCKFLLENCEFRKLRR